MSLTNALNNAVSGLRANARLAEVTSGNLANALTPGYGRQSVTLSALAPGGQPGGVRVEGLNRAMDPEISAARRLADADLAGADAKADALLRIEAAIGKTDDPSSLVNRIGAFENGLRELGESPGTPAQQEAAARAATDLAGKFNRISNEITAVRESADREIAARVEAVNGSLRTISRLNREIQIFEATARDSAALFDERERLIDEVSQNLPVRRTERADGRIELATREGLPLVDTRARRIEFVPTPTFAAGSSGSGLTLGGRDITPDPSGSLPQRIRDGALAGLFAVRDAIAPKMGLRIDSIAADIASRFEDPAVDPTVDVAAGRLGLFTDAQAALPAPTQAGIMGFASRIEVNRQVDPGRSGDAALMRDGVNATGARAQSDPRIPNAMRDTLLDARDANVPPATPGVAGVFTPAARATAVTELAATDRVAAEAEISVLGTTRNALADEESATLGVDEDAELQRLVQIEQAYAANAQVIQATSRMLEELTRIR